jgi:chemotaxis protein CheC
MELTPSQQDALSELVNIAFSRTASALSNMTNNRVDLEAPAVSIHPIEDLDGSLVQFVSGDVATVHQIFSGSVSGDGLLLINHEGAVLLVDLLTGEQSSGRSLRPSAKEVLSEIGNILLSSCLGIFGDLLQVRFTFTVPRLHLDDLGSLLNSLVIEKEGIRHALVIGARFQLQQSQVTGCLMIVLGVHSLERLLAAIEEWAFRATSGPGGEATPPGIGTG